MSTSTYQRELKAIAQDLGYEAEMSNGGHIKFRHKRTGNLVFAPATPRLAERTIKNMRAYLRKGAAGSVRIKKKKRQGQSVPA